MAKYLIAHELAHVVTLYPILRVKTGLATSGPIEAIFQSLEDHLADFIVYHEWGFADEMRALIRAGQIEAPKWWGVFGESAAVTGEKGRFKSRAEAK
jgi:hypothetical protein